MLQIQKGVLNQLAVTLTEKKAENLPDIWLFRFINEQSNKDYFCNLSDLSVSDRYNLFHFYEGTDLTLPVGEYKYEIYQMPVLDSDIYDDGVLCESGKMRVLTPETLINEFVQTTTTKNVYE